MKKIIKVLVTFLLLVMCSCSNGKINQKILDIFDNEDDLTLLLESSLASNNGVAKEIHVFPSFFDEETAKSTDKLVVEINNLYGELFNEVDAKVNDIKDLIHSSNFKKVDNDQLDKSAVVSFINTSKNINIYFCEDGFIRIVSDNYERQFYQMDTDKLDKIINYSLEIATMTIDYYDKMLETRALYI